MTIYDGIIDRPAPAPVAERFSESLGAAITELHRSHSSHATAQVVTELHTPECVAQIDEAIDQARIRLDALLDEAERAAAELAAALGMRAWRDNPLYGYRSVPLAASSRHRPGTMSVQKLVAELRAIARSPLGAPNLDAPAPQIRIEDLYKKPRVQVPTAADYVTSGEGYESPDARVVGGQG